MSKYKDLGKRVFTAVLGLIAIIGLIVWGDTWGLKWVVGAISLGMTYELSNLIYALPDRRKKTFVLVFANLTYILVSGFWLHLHWVTLGFLFVFLSTYFLITAKRYAGPLLQTHTQELMSTIFGLFYLSFLPSLLNLIRVQPEGLHWVFLFLIMVWTTDTGAYFAGVRFGKHRLYPEISPKKSIEGLIGGVVCSCVCSGVYKYFLADFIGFQTVILLSVTVSLASQAGDLFESMLKRAFDKKDSGSLLPGHGGFLDRFDGVVFALPVLYAYLVVLFPLLGG